MAKANVFSNIEIVPAGTFGTGAEYCKGNISRKLSKRERYAEAEQLQCKDYIISYKRVKNIGTDFEFGKKSKKQIAYQSIKIGKIKEERYFEYDLYKVSVEEVIANLVEEYKYTADETTPQFKNAWKKYSMNDKDIICQYFNQITNGILAKKNGYRNYHIDTPSTLLKILH